MRTCRNCGASLTETFADLGHQPLANAYLHEDQLDEPETTYPLHAMVCSECLLVQVGDSATPAEIFEDYAYFSGTSPTWVEHARAYATQMHHRIDLDAESLVVEVGSNDGYLLQHFKDDGIPVLGIEPAANIACAAMERDIPIRCAFFNLELARELHKAGIQADLLCGTNVLAHVPDIHSFVAGIKLILSGFGICTMEFPEIRHLIGQGEFDTIYHEHFHYFSFHTVADIFRANGLEIFDVESLPTHGGSIRIFAQHAAGPRSTTPAVGKQLATEGRAGLDQLATHTAFAERPGLIKADILNLLANLKLAGHTIAGYGAPAKGNTLLNYCGIGPELIDYVVDDSPHKQHLYLPGSHIPIVPASRLQETPPDYVLLLAWNLKEPILAANPQIQRWIIPFPRLEILTP